MLLMQANLDPLPDLITPVASHLEVRDSGTLEVSGRDQGGQLVSVQTLDSSTIRLSAASRTPQTSE